MRAVLCCKTFGAFGGFENDEVFSRGLLAGIEHALRSCAATGGAARYCGTRDHREKTAGAQKLAGYFNLYWDAKQGKLWLEIDKWNTEFLYQSGLSAGVGSNDIGLDRGQLGATRIVRFERSGPKVLLVQENLDYRAVSDDPAEKRAVHDSFAESVLCGIHGGRGRKRSRAGGRHGVFPARRSRHSRNTAAAPSRALIAWIRRAARFTCR